MRTYFVFITIQKTTVFFPCIINTFSGTAGMSPKAFLKHSITATKTEPQWTWGNTSKSVSWSETWKASMTCSPLWHLACATNSYFLAKSTEAGYLFLLTTPSPNIKRHKFLSMFPAQTTTSVIKPSPWHIKLWIKGKQMFTNKHLTLSFTFCFFLTPMCLTA